MPNTHEMSIKLVHAARITDTTGALLDESRVRRRPRNTVKNDVFHIARKKTLVDDKKSVDRIRAGVDQGSGARPPKGSAAGAASVYLIAVGSLSSPKERVESRPCRRPHRNRVFYSVCCFFHFSGFVAQDGSTWLNIGPNNAGNARRTGVLRLHRGRLLG